MFSIDAGELGSANKSFSLLTADKRTNSGGSATEGTVTRGWAT